MEFQLSCFKSWKMMLWKCCTSYASKFGKLSSSRKTGKGQFSLQCRRKAMPKNAQTTAQLHSSRMLIWRGQWHPTPVLLPGESHGWRNLVGCSPWRHGKSDTTERLHFDFSLSCIGEGNGNPLQYSCLENPRDGGSWWAAVYGVTQSQTRLKWLSSSSSSIIVSLHQTISVLSPGFLAVDILRGLLLGRKAMTNLDSILKSRDIQLLCQQRSI